MALWTKLSTVLIHCSSVDKVECWWRLWNWLIWQTKYGGAYYVTLVRSLPPWSRLYAGIKMLRHTIQAKILESSITVGLLSVNGKLGPFNYILSWVGLIGAGTWGEGWAMATLEIIWVGIAHLEFPSLEIVWMKTAHPGYCTKIVQYYDIKQFSVSI